MCVCVCVCVCACTCVCVYVCVWMRLTNWIERVDEAKESADHIE